MSERQKEAQEHLEWELDRLRGLTREQTAHIMGARKAPSAFETQVGGNHYENMAIQPLEFCHRNKLGPAETLAIKYICRHPHKAGRRDIEKAIHVLQMLLELDYPTTS
jgi:hypothetical protein